MAEIRQIQVDGVNYDLVISEDEVSATAAAQSAAQALAYKNQAQTSAAQAQTQATNASNQADRAEDAASRAEQIVGGEFLSYGGDQELNETEKEQARKNAVVGKSNYNLLDNSWFTVRQRGNGPFSAPNYTVDRWKLTAGSAQLSFNSNGGVITPNGSYLLLTQYTRIPSTIGIVTASIKINGTVYSVTGNAATGFQLSLVDVWGSGRIEVAASGGYLNFIIGASTAATFEAVKLELGTYSTLANDTKPDYATELARCIYSQADSVDSYANNGFSRSNRNLVDNPFFTIHQKGTAGITGDGYAVDRWKNTGGSTLTQTPKSPYGITFAASSGYQVDQALWAYEAAVLDGKTLTLSIMTVDGIASATGIFTATSSTAAKVFVNSVGGEFTVGLYYIPSVRAVPFVRITTPSGAFPVNADILAVKLEIGSVSTLASDIPPEYGAELAKCQRYYYRIGNATYLTACRVLAENSGNAYGLMPLPVQMRAQPTVSYSGSFLLWSGSTGTTIAVTSITINNPAYPSVNPAVVNLRAQATSGMTQGQYYDLQCRGDTSAFLELLADI